ncbi:MAG: T9SS type A sorting domain-containing protein [Flavobacterium sp.]|nr:T9SS type A sorting domain-containing protein [Flavobacterium sp.]
MKTKLFSFLILMISSISFAQTVTTIAGSAQGYLDGPVATAQFTIPTGVAIDASGNIYVADANNAKIRKISTSGTVSTFAGSTNGYADGTGTAAQFSSPTSITIDASGNLYVADRGNHKIRKITPAGVVSTIAGSTLGYLDDIGTSARFYYPNGVTVDSSGNLYVADGGNNRIRKITPTGQVTTLAGSSSGYVDDIGTAAKFNTPYGIVVDGTGNIYVADWGNHKIRKITQTRVVTTFAGSTGGYADGLATTAKFFMPRGVAIDGLGNVYVADTTNDKIRKISSDGNVTTIAGSTYGFADGAGTAAQFSNPFGLVVDLSGDLIIADTYNDRIRKIDIPNLPIINTITEKPAAINATLYTYVNGNGSSISNVVVKYGLTSGNLNNQLSAVGISPNSYYGAIINGLAENTTYYYKVEVTNDGGTTSSAIDSFTTGSKQTVAEYSFDNVYTDFSGNNAFPSNASSSFVADRNGNPTSALNLNNNGTATAIPGLPIDGSTRTVSLWVNNANATWNYAFSYGGILTDLAFIGVVQNNSLDFHCFSNGFQATVTNPLATWMHLVYTYDGVNVRMYKNGVLVGTSPFNLFTAYDADYFYLGSSFGDMNSFNGSVDDLKIYNYPLTQTEITNLYNNNTLSTSDFNQNDLEVVLYPNPVQDILSVDTVNTIKSVEVYNLQGQKVLVSNQSQINLSNLSAGIYMVRIEDENNAVNTKRIIKK